MSSPYEFLPNVGREPLSEKRVGSITLVEYTGRKQVFHREQELLNIYKQESDKCPVCDKVWKLTVDHIVPMDTLEDYGVTPKHWFIKENLRVLCERCNQYKANRLDFSLPETKIVLSSLLELF